MYTPYSSSFNVSVTTDGLTYLSNITLNYGSTCVAGMVFVYSDGTITNTGYTSTSSITLDMNNKRLSKANSYTGAIVDCLQICAIDTDSTESCISSCNGAPSTFLNTLSYNIGSYYGDYYNYYGHLCLLNIGINLAPCNI
jgi:hypothetical protein